MCRSKMPLACVWHEVEWFYTVGPVPQNGVSDLADEKRLVSMPLIQNGFIMLTHVTFKLSVNVPLTPLTS